MNEEIKQVLKENKFIILGIVGGLIMIGFMMQYGFSMINYQQQNINDHWQTATKDLDKDFPNKDHCLDLIAWLSDHYNLDQSSDKYWMQYQGAVYDKAKSLGCSQLPQPIKEINP